MDKDLLFHIFNKVDKEKLNCTRPIGEERCFRNITNLDKQNESIQDMYFIDNFKGNNKECCLLNKTAQQAIILCLKYFKNYSLIDFYKLIEPKGIKISYFI